MGMMPDYKTRPGVYHLMSEPALFFLGLAGIFQSPVEADNYDIGLRASGADRGQDFFPIKGSAGGGVIPVDDAFRRNHTAG
jgi:hypothetical protein